MKKLLLLLLTFSMVISLLVFLPGCADVVPEPTDEEKELLDGMINDMLWGTYHRFNATAIPNDIADSINRTAKSFSSDYKSLSEKYNFHELLLWKFFDMIDPLTLETDYGVYSDAYDLWCLLQSPDFSEKMSKKQKKLFDKKSEAFLELYYEVVYEPIDDQTAVS